MEKTTGYPSEPPKRLSWAECREIQEQWKRDAQALAEVRLAYLLDRANKLINKEKS